MSKSKAIAGGVAGLILIGAAVRDSIKKGNAIKNQESRLETLSRENSKLSSKLASMKDDIDSTKASGDSIKGMKSSIEDSNLEINSKIKALAGEINRVIHTWDLNFEKIAEAINDERERQTSN